MAEQKSRRRAEENLNGGKFLDLKFSAPAGE
jgi:hypothetical protein